MTARRIEMAVGGFLVLVFLAFIFFTPGFKERLLSYLAILFPFFALIFIEFLRGVIDSPACVGYGFKTSLESTDPVFTVDVPNPKDPLNPIHLDGYANGGCRPFWYRGGGKQGWTVIRRDLAIKVPGDKVTVIAMTAPPDIFRVGAGAGSEYFDAEKMPKQLYNALRQIDGGGLKGNVTCFWEPPKYDPLKDWDEKEGMPWKFVAFMANKELGAYEKRMDKLTTASTEIADTYANTMRSLNRTSKEDVGGDDDG